VIIQPVAPHIFVYCCYPCSFWPQLQLNVLPAVMQMKCEWLVSVSFSWMCRTKTYNRAAWRNHDIGEMIMRDWRHSKLQLMKTSMTGRTIPALKAEKFWKSKGAYSAICRNNRITKIIVPY